MLPSIIPRSILFGAPERLYPALSPCGGRIGFVAPVDGVPNVWVQTVGRDDARPLTDDREAGVNAFNWAADGRHVLYPQDNHGDENTHLYAVALAGGRPRNLTPFDGVRVKLIGAEPARPRQVLVALNRRRSDLHDAYLVDVHTGALTLAAENPGFAGWLADRELRVRSAFRWNPDGGLTILVRSGTDGWRPVHTVDSDDSTLTRAIGFSADGRRLAVLSPRGANTVRLLSIDLATGAETVCYEDPRHDVESVGLSPLSGEADLVTVGRERLCLEAIQPGVAGDVAELRRRCRGDVIMLSRVARDRIWLVMDYVDDGPAKYHVYDRASREMTLLFSHHPVLERYRLANIEPFSFTARDGLVVHGYLTFPVGVPRSRLPAVLAVHGGPWSRDSWGARGDAQWLANRGYLCVQVNYRGSTGYGKEFVNAGDREWGGRMQDDLVDAVRWLAGRGLVDPARVAVYGHSYGGYAALTGAAMTPDVFRAAIAVCAPSDLRTFVSSVIRTSALLGPRVRRRIGDPDADAALLWSRSPLSRAGDIRIPVLVAHGANDPRVPRSEAEQLVAVLRANDVPHEYLLFPDEGHGFMKPRNRIAFYAAAERFLAEHLGGRHEPQMTDVS